MGAIVLAALAGCGSTPSPNLYLIPSPTLVTAGPNTTHPAAHTVEDPGAFLLAVADVTLPSYAKDRRIAVQADSAKLAREEGHRWAADPEDLVVEALVHRLRARRVDAWPLPLPPPYRADKTLVVRFDEFLLHQNSTAQLAGHFAVINEGRPTVSQPFQLRSGRVDGAGDYAAAVGTVLDELSGLITAALEPLPEGTDD
ncbi:MAG: ABC-type transport auxiliary lipoprotein family protein [Pseudomonadota bacterium]